MFFFFFKQKTAYEMRISDWSSDVCSSDLPFLDVIEKEDLREIGDGQKDGNAREAGASVHKYGGLGFARFAEEVQQQEAELGYSFDYIVVCTVTGSTHAGMIAGFALQGRQRNVIGIDASFTPAQTRAQVLDIARNTSALIGGDEIVDEDVIIEEDYAYPAYGVPSQETLEDRKSTRLNSSH